MENISQQIELFLSSRKYTERYTSFDFCYSYFHKFYKEKSIKDIANKNYIQQSCLHIGFYLASWGMMRGSSFLLQKSLGFLKDLVVLISHSDKIVWEIDVDNYSDENIKKLLDLYVSIDNLFKKHGHKASPTLITKIMLGVFGNIPAFDRYFRKGIRVHSVNIKNLQKIHNFYKENQKQFNQFKIQCYDFQSESKNSILYPKAKLIDMYGFSKGFNTNT